MSSTVDLLRQFAKTRAFSEALAQPLSDADASVQSMDDASPAKWHLAHTTWFFETFVLAAHAAGYRPYNPAFAYLFNSYYDAAGPRHARSRRGMLTRPSLAEILDYRACVNSALTQTLPDLPPAALALVELGIQHEQQHQELLLADILHLFAQNPLEPVYSAVAPMPRAHTACGRQWVQHAGGITATGNNANGFAFDCEGPRHDVLLQPFALGTHLVTNAQWIDFIDAGGYRSAAGWLADGWAWVNAEDIVAPLYWARDDTGWTTFTLGGRRPVDPDAPVTHISYFEADAFAGWAGARLPREAEWEALAGFDGVEQLFGDCWQWTQSAYAAYPGFRPAAGAVGEYNGKFMCGQFVLKGASCITPGSHSRASYRNFFYPHQRWQFTGLRLAKDVSTIKAAA